MSKEEKREYNSHRKKLNTINEPKGMTEQNGEKDRNEKKETGSIETKKDKNICTESKNSVKKEARIWTTQKKKWKEKKRCQFQRDRNRERENPSIS